MEQTISVSKWGNGYGVHLPKRYLDANDINEKSKIYIRFEGENLILMPKREKKTRTYRSLEQIAIDCGWDGKSYELIDEDIAWLNMKSVGEEVQL